MRPRGLLSSNPSIGVLPQEELVHTTGWGQGWIFRHAHRGPHTPLVLAGGEAFHGICAAYGCRYLGPYLATRKRLPAVTPNATPPNETGPPPPSELPSAFHTSILPCAAGELGFHDSGV